MSNKNKNSSLVLIHISLSMDGQSACFVYINVYTLRLFGWEREGVKQRPHTVCVLMPLSLPNIVRCYITGKHKFPHLLQYRITLGIVTCFFLGNAMYRESERSANIMATTEHSIHPNLNIPKNVALGS